LKVVVDTSALIAILAGEPERQVFLDLLLKSEPVVSAATLIETLRIVQVQRGAARLEDVHEVIASVEIAVMPVDEAQVHLAQEGMLRFGTGRGTRPAVLNFGDLFAYALAKHLAAPLLYKGTDFAATDVTSALPFRD
jgi:ribonuclease VapC